GRIILSSRERLVAVEPFEGGLMMSTLRTADEVRTAEFDKLPDKIDPEMVAMAEQIIDRFGGQFDPGSFRDRYQDALRELVEAKLKGVKRAARPSAEPSNVIDLMSALKRSVEAEAPGAAAASSNGKKGRAREPDRRQQNMLLPVKGGGKKPAAAAEKVAAPA